MTYKDKNKFKSIYYLKKINSVIHEYRNNLPREYKIEAYFEPHSSKLPLN